MARLRRIAASSRASVAASGRTARGGTNAVPYSTPGSGRKTAPTSKRARSVIPRARLRCAICRSPGTRERRSAGACPSMGFAIRTLGSVSPDAEPCRSFCSAVVNGNEGVSTSPAAASALATRRRPRCAAVSPRPAGAVGTTEGMRSYPSIRATSSARVHLSVRSGRHVGGVTSHPLAVFDDVAADELERAAHLVARVVDPDEPRYEARRKHDRLPFERGQDGAAEGIGDAARELDHEIDDALGRRKRHGGSTPRSNRREASLGSLWRRAVRAIETGSKVAASTSTERVCVDISVAAPPMTPARPIGPDSSAITRSSGSSVRVCPSSVSSRSPARARRTVMPPWSRSRS